MQYMKELFEYRMKVSKHEWEIFANKFKEIKFPARAVVSHKDVVENYLYFIKQGILRHYIPGEKSEKTFDYSYANEFTGAYDSFISRTPAYYQIETVMPSTLVRIAYDDLQRVYADVPLGNALGKMITEGLYAKKAKWEKSLLMDTPQQRYVKLTQEHGMLIENASMKNLASYIGVTPSALSRIVKRISG